MKSLIVKRSVVVDGHKTSVSLEDSFWNDLKEIAHYERVPLSELLAKIDGKREHGVLELGPGAPETKCVVLALATGH